MSHYEGRATNPNRLDSVDTSFKYTLPVSGHDSYLSLLSRPRLRLVVPKRVFLFSVSFPVNGLRDPVKKITCAERDLNKREVTNRLNSLLIGMNKPSADGYCEIKSADCNICSSDHSNTRIKRPVLIPRTRSMRTYGG
jgi:hypothetical protein